MNDSIDFRLRQQERVNDYFQFASSRWKEVYVTDGVFAEIIQDRHRAVLAWVDSLNLAPTSRVLEVGCGAGYMSVALAQRGFYVQAIDSLEAMVELTRQNAVESETTDLVSAEVGDIYCLGFRDEAFDLVIAIGVFPWLERAELAIQEMARVTKRGGYLILTTANQSGLATHIDPWRKPLLLPLKLRVKESIERIRHRHFLPSMVFHSNRFIDEVLKQVGFIKTKGMTRGFGFTFHHQYLPEPLATMLHRWLQRVADRNMPIIRSIGMNSFILARRRSL